MRQDVTKIWGIKDEPLKDIESDQLNLAEHAEILADFIRLCDTPITVGIQGDWGSGKTSMINIIQNKLKADTERKFVSAVFNTWLYSQFNLGDQLALSLIADLIETVSQHTSDESNRQRESLETTLHTLGRLALSTANIAATLYAGSEIDLSKPLSKALKPDPERDIRPVKMLARLKTDIQELIRDARETKNIDRFVIFVDDLDRLVPSRAVELLEALKIFLDVEGCVFVLACDYQVVSRGIREKFGHQEQDMDGRSFFDKIIQVPYNMPIHKYDSRRFLRNLLERIQESTDIDDDCVEIYRNLVDRSVGLNPRSCKRLFNSFLLVRLVSDKEELFEDLARSGIAVPEKQAGQYLFAAVCLQMGYERAFKEMCRSSLDSAWFDRVGDDQYWAIDKNARKLTKTDQEATRFRFFLEAFRDAVRLENNSVTGELSPEHEARVLQKVLNSSKVATVSDEAKEEEPEDSIPGYINRFFTTLVEPELIDFEREEPEVERDGRSSYYNLYIYGDDEAQTYLLLSLAVRIKRCTLEIRGCGETAAFRKVRDYLLENQAGRWIECRGDQGRMLQKEVLYVAPPEFEFAKLDLINDPEQVASGLSGFVQRAFETFRQAVATVYGEQSGRK